MILAFYKVDNSKGYGRHEFDNDTDNNVILEKLNSLKDDEVKFYNTGYVGWDNAMAGMGEFEEDYNDEELDGGWWLVVILEK